MSDTKQKPIVSPTITHERRIPPGQVITSKFPVYDIAPRHEFDPAVWRFGISGLVKETIELTWDEFTSLRRVEVLADFHCVTTWSKQSMLWEGVPTRAVYDLVEPDPEADFLMIECSEGYTTNLSLDDFLQDDCLFAINLDGVPLEPEHGAPLRLVIPQLYAWKSAKYACGMRLMAGDSPGFWEERGYHMRGDPWAEERFWNSTMKPWEIRKKK